MPRPAAAALARDMAAIRGAGADALVSLLEVEESAGLGLAAEADAAAAAGLRFLHFPVADYGIPEDAAAFRALLSELRARLAAGGGIAVHCRGGIGRSGTLVSCLCGAGSAAEAMRIVSAARGVEVPETDAQRDLIREVIDRRPR
ncbi:sulfur transferase domain-containing protein [Oceanicola sp. 22II-s10i]|uniref:phosphatase domain-containing putative toxin n=1 Tax=Oceanicola sp. 22II-s10i TaxID=1317116 RepID=UPI000B51E6D0|nr:sulfur transferase domain-containing protein [Oceanicola sp. 22II-s10i]